ncbi:hypothetical protein [Hymenobacter rubidus]|uniref:hypothetical protein n=1 Tax=Hymenobacter rubidus TaxID=1441626 RepID=UPI00191DC00E|nr:hypothetical protein [Hymenobacter rubidus]
MVKPSPVLLLSAAALLANCQHTPHPAATPTTSEFTTTLTVADARAAVAGYLQTQPNAALYLLDSAHVTDNETSWQVLVPRTDWAHRLPSRARFEVDKTTGNVHPGAVK